MVEKLQLILTQLGHKRHELLVLAQWQDGAFVRRNRSWEAEILQTPKISNINKNKSFLYSPRLTLYLKSS